MSVRARSGRFPRRSNSKGTRYGWSNRDPLGERKNALDTFLETKVAEGFRIETHTDTHAIIIVGGHRRPLWSRVRKQAASSRYVVSVDERGEVTMIPAEPKRN